MRTLLFLILWFISLTASAQYLKLDNSVILSAYSNDKDLPILDSRIANYAGTIGLDYLENDWFSLSSQIGYMRIGGEQDIDIGAPEIGRIIERKNYVHINTTFRARRDVTDVSFFIGAGPTIDILAGSRDAENPFFTGYTYNNVRIGGKAEVGVVQTKDKFRFGIVGGYLRSFSPTTETEFISLYNHAFTGAITVGYHLQ